jgi:flagellar biosynthesis chaperone FliJ
MEEATLSLAKLAQDKASKLDMLDDAEKRIENRLNDALLPKLTGHRFEHTVRFLEMKPKAITQVEGEETEKILELPKETHHP